MKVLYHGTDVVFQLGDELLPSRLTGRKNHSLSDPNLIYLSSSKEVAFIFASDFCQPGQTPKVYKIAAPTAVKSEAWLPDSEDSHEWITKHATVIETAS